MCVCVFSCRLAHAYALTRMHTYDDAHTNDCSNAYIHQIGWMEWMEWMEWMDGSV